jgi:hypothetical protein
MVVNQQVIGHFPIQRQITGGVGLFPRSGTLFSEPYLGCFWFLLGLS